MENKQVSLTVITFKQKEFVWKLLQQYLGELSQFGEKKKSDDGEYVYEYFDSYWKEKERFPLFVMVDSEIAGFIFVNNHSVLSEDKNLHAIGEFYILPQFRKAGIGSSAAVQLFNRFPGKWEAAQLSDNTPAITFWRKVIKDYTKGNFQEFRNSLGPVQIFQSIL